MAREWDMGHKNKEDAKKVAKQLRKIGAKAKVKKTYYRKEKQTRYDVMTEFPKK